MTRRGSLAYYPAAVVCGSFFLAASYFPFLALARHVPVNRWARGFLAMYFLTVLMGLVSLLLGAFLLRWIASHRRLTTATEWMAAGVSVFAVVVGTQGVLALALQHHVIRPHFLSVGYTYLLIGPWFVLNMPLWLPLPAAIATAYVLFLVDRAFASKPESPAESQAS